MNIERHLKTLKYYGFRLDLLKVFNNYRKVI